MVRTESEVPLEEALGIFTDGDNACSAWPSSPDTSAVPTCSGVNTSIGTALSNTLRSLTREPNTLMASKLLASEVDVWSAQAMSPLHSVTNQIPSNRRLLFKTFPLPSSIDTRFVK
jgi:hypothetical protein